MIGLEVTVRQFSGEYLDDTFWRGFVNAGEVRNGVVSNDLPEEIKDTLREKFDWSDTDIAAGGQPLWNCALSVTPTAHLAIVAADPDDDRILECAVAAEADFLVTGDDHLLNLTEADLKDIAFERHQILTLRAFLNRAGW